MTRRRLLVVAAAVLVVVVGIGTWIAWPRGTTEVTEGDALADFRTRTSTSTSGLGDRTEPDSRPPVPDAGVYTYSATGAEDVKLGPLPTQHRPLPDSITAVVVHPRPGCFELTINYFVEHVEATTYCVGDGGSLAIAAHVKHQQIGSLSPTATVTCDPATVLAEGRDDVDLACTLALSGGPISVTAELAGRAAAGPEETVVVGGTKVAATPVTVERAVSGDLTGRWTETLWLDDRHLPVRIERTLDLAGPATFAETSTLVLTDLAPAT